MKKLLILTLLSALFLSAESIAVSPATFKSIKIKATKNISIQTALVEKIADADPKAIKKVNAALKTMSTEFEREVKRCSISADGHPWGYELAVEKIIRSREYLSVVFSKFTVCAGSPSIAKEARVFSLISGNLIQPKNLFKILFPKAELANGAFTNNNLIQLNEEMAETLIKDSKAILNIYDKECEFYLKTTSYRIWVEDRNVIFFPEFLQPISSCQKEYLIRMPD
ncbi:hypothetical protein [Massilia sp. PWRC2]|uniref:hypothetical protein n=1 Tax=Massilia sp. PWRC2 TaxID=2804626 RepID=UPI003CF62719